MKSRVFKTSVVLLAGMASSAAAQAPNTLAATAPANPPSSVSAPVEVQQGSGCSTYAEAPTCCDSAPCRALFQSDPCFPRFISPMTNPILNKDPRSMTEARFLFINNNLPGDHALGGGDFQVYAVQLRAALTDRLTLIADKDGIADMHTNGAGDRSGWLNMNFGLRYLLVRDVENQFLWSAGFTIEPPMGEREVFENHGNGVMTVFTTVGKEVNCNWHILNTFGYQFGFDPDENSSFVYNSLHIDRQVFGWLYPLAELNWFHYTGSGDRGLPAALGEGDGLLNLGTSGVTGNDLVTAAVGVKAKIGCHAETGVAFEAPISNRKDLIDNRLVFDFILRY